MSLPTLPPRTPPRLLPRLLPMTCTICGARGPAPCAGCWRGLHPAPVLPPPPGLDACHSLLLYEGDGRELVARLKYRNARSGLDWLAKGMAGLVSSWRDGTSDAVVTWAPTTPERRRARGFDHAELLARRVSHHLGVPCARLLWRGHGPAQTGRAAEDRHRGIVFRPVDRVPRAVILVDDIRTTGATLEAAARALRSASSESVIAVTAGCTPLKVTK